MLHLGYMKYICILFILSLLSCERKDISRDIAIEGSNSKLDFDWLLGNWKRVNDDGENLTFESWVKNDNSTYTGVGFTLLQADTVWQEQMRLINSDEGWIFEAISKGEAAPTLFPLTEISPDSFTSQNPEHDFPTQIKYFKSGEDLKAVISGEGMEIYFDFVKI